MDGLFTAVVILGLFLLRLGVPLLISLAIGYFLHRLDARWQAEAEAQTGDQPERGETIVDAATGGHYGRIS